MCLGGLNGFGDVFASLLGDVFLDDVLAGDVFGDDFGGFFPGVFAVALGDVFRHVFRGLQVSFSTSFRLSWVTSFGFLRKAWWGMSAWDVFGRVLFNVCDVFGGDFGDVLGMSLRFHG